MSLEQKIEILNNEKIPQVYEAGQKSMVDESKVIEKTVSGTGFLNIDDVSEIPHNIEIQLTSDTIADFSNTEVIVRGKNLWDKEYASDKSNWGFLDNSYSSIAIYVGKGNMVTFSYKNALEIGLKFYAAVMTENSCASSVTTWIYHNTMQSAISRIATIKATEDYVYIRMTPAYFSQFMEYIGNDLQIEIGSIATSYESFIEEKYTLNLNGKVVVKSMSPIMNIYTNETDINISANYHKSYSMQAEYDRFWNAFQENGNRKVYHSAFCYSGWNDETFKPKYNITPTNGSDYMFEYCQITNFAEALKQSGITLDFSVTSMYNTFYYAQKLTHLPPIIPKSGSRLTSTWYGCSELVSIEKLVVDSKHTFSSVFNYCSNLVNLIIEGTIGNNGLNLQWSTKLSKESITSVINALSSTTSGLSITLSATAVKNAFNIDNLEDDTTWGEDSEYYILRHSKDNWTISYI